MLKTQCVLGARLLKLSGVSGAILVRQEKMTPMSIERIVMVMAGLWLAAFGTSGLGQPSATRVLTDREVAEGWIALYDGETTFGWLTVGDAQWRQGGGVIEGSGGGVGALRTTTHFANFVLSLEFYADREANAGVAVRGPASGPITEANSYLIRIGDAHPRWPTGSVSGLLRSVPRRPTVGKWTKMEIRCEGNQLTVRLDDRAGARLNNPNLVAGPIGLYYGGTGTVRFRNIKLQPLGLTPLFNGKDLSGWRIVPGTQATYSVTREGWLNVRNGRGDLQTEASFGDFVLQLEGITHGKGLNSGIFFRANPGGFWSGYEVQIRNQWTDDDRTKPLDFGTGGIYNRQPARKVVSNDEELFALTLVARGNHLATWVNGYQVTDFVDTREPDQTNARRGARTAPGVISIQGHDPTTNLSFRNIRIAEFPSPPEPKR